MNREIDEELRSLFARLEDLSRRAAQGECVHTPFLSPGEQHHAADYLRARGVEHRFFGGYAEAERQKLYLLPDYMQDVGEQDAQALLAAYGQSTEIAVLHLQGSGYRALGHRDFLGALLHLGLERNVLGDIAVFEEEPGALLFCEEKISAFLMSELSRAGSDRLTVRRVTHESFSVPPRRYERMQDTVASPRLDAVAAALCRLSREKGGALVRAGQVELNYEREERGDRTVCDGSILSIRGYGKFRILSVTEQTKKGRFRLLADRFL